MNFMFSWQKQANSIRSLRSFEPARTYRKSISSHHCLTASIIYILPLAIELFNSMQTYTSAEMAVVHVPIDLHPMNVSRSVISPIVFIKRSARVYMYLIGFIGSTHPGVGRFN